MRIAKSIPNSVYTLKKMSAFMTRIFHILCFLCFLASFTYASDADLLKTSDIAAVMKNILDEHLGEKNISKEAFQHAISYFIDQFDKDHIYLLEHEISPYLTPSDSLLQKGIDEYQRKDFELFQNLNSLFQQAILRSRNMRTVEEKNSKTLLFSKEGLSLLQQSNSAFAKNESELKQKILQDIEQYIEKQKKKFGNALTPEMRDQVLISYENTRREFEKQYLYQNEKGELLSKEQQDNLFSLHVLKALAASLDAHTTFYKSAEAYDFRLRLEKEFKGIGLVLKEAPQGAIVSQILEGGPAAKNGQIHIGDRIVEIDGKSVTHVPFTDIIECLHGEKNSVVKLTLVPKNNKDSKFTVELTREMIILKNDRVDVSSEAFGDGVIGIITLHAFYQGNDVSSEEDVKNAITSLGKKGHLRGLILDLRSNSGGFLSQAVKVAGLFITDGVIVISKSGNGEEKIYRDVDGKTFYDGPLIVLVSKITASAAEIVAEALQDWGVAIIVGDEHTYGKGTIQTQTVTDNQSSSYFKVTVGKYYTVSGRTPQKTGVKSDILVPGHWNKQDIGEMYANSVDPDQIDPKFNDSLNDVPEKDRSWYLQYYIPKMQKQSEVWRKYLPMLRKNSSYRIEHNKNYQLFIKGTVNDSTEEENTDDTFSNKNKTYGEDDLQLQETVNIMKDMILLQKP